MSGTGRLPDALIDAAPVVELHGNSESPAPPQALEALVVEPTLDEILRVTSPLVAVGFRVTAADNFAQAKSLLASQRPAVLVTALRLGAYNGLHLVLRGKTIQPKLAAIVLSPTVDAVLQSDAEAMGATFVITPIAGRDLVGAVLQSVFRAEASSDPIRPPFERRMRDRRSNVDIVSPDRRRNDRRHEIPWLTLPPPTNLI